MHRDERNRGISRARFLAGARAVGAAAAAGPLLAGAPASAATTGRRGGRGKGKGLTHRGVCYTIGAGETPGTAWSTARMRADLRAIRNDLHATSVEVTGDGVDRLNATASEAAELGLHIWLQPTLGDRPASEILDHLAETGRHLERLRRQGARADLSVGCEFWLFVPGIVPGANAQERIRNLMEGNYDPEQMMRRLSAFTARAAAVGRSVFGGKLSYAAAQDDEVDWSLFDIVGIDYYSYFPDCADYLRELRPYLRWGKPLAITEFGTCTYTGAPQQGGAWAGTRSTTPSNRPKSKATWSAASAPRPPISPNSSAFSRRWACTPRWPSSSSPPTPRTHPSRDTTWTWPATPW